MALVRRYPPTCFSPRTKLTHNDCLTPRIGALPQGRHQRLRRAWHQDGGQSRRLRHESRCALSSTIAPGASIGVALALEQRGARQRQIVDGEFDKMFDQRKAEADEFYRTVIPERITADRSQSHAPGVRWLAMEQAVLLLRRQPLDRGRSGGSRRFRKSAQADAIMNGVTSTMPM